jgi:hypothetical protein
MRGLPATRAAPAWGVVLAALTFPFVVLGATLAVTSSCNPIGSMPPLLGTAGDSGLGDLSAEAYDPGMCPGTGTVSVGFDGGSGQNTCWSAFAAKSATQATVTLAGNLTAKPGLALGMTLVNYGTVCSIGPGAKVALDGPCISIAASYVSSEDKDVWQAFGGNAPGSPLQALGTDAGSHGTLTVTSYGFALGSTISVTFSPDSTLVVDEPGHPSASISGSVTASVE